MMLHLKDVVQAPARIAFPSVLLVGHGGSYLPHQETIRSRKSPDTTWRLASSKASWQLVAESLSKLYTEYRGCESLTVQHAMTYNYNYLHDLQLLVFVELAYFFQLLQKQADSAGLSVAPLDLI
jgi:hypothetical protein